LDTKPWKYERASFCIADIRYPVDLSKIGGVRAPAKGSMQPWPYKEFPGREARPAAPHGYAPFAFPKSAPPSWMVAPELVKPPSWMVAPDIRTYRLPDDDRPPFIVP
jgi:hypothetical protein